MINFQNFHQVHQEDSKQKRDGEVVMQLKVNRFIKQQLQKHKQVQRNLTSAIFDPFKAELYTLLENKSF